MFKIMAVSQPCSKFKRCNYTAFISFCAPFAPAAPNKSYGRCGLLTALLYALTMHKSVLEKKVVAKLIILLTQHTNQFCREAKLQCLYLIMLR